MTWRNFQLKFSFFQKEAPFVCIMNVRESDLKNLKWRICCEMNNKHVEDKSDGKPLKMDLFVTVFVHRC